MNREHLTDIFDAALSAVDPFESVLSALRIEGRSMLAAGAGYQLDAVDRIIVLGAGKASLRMAAAAEKALGGLVSEGIVIAPHGQTSEFRAIEVCPASHPLPDDAGVEATKRILELARSAGGKTLIVFLLSGGGSALLVAPAAGISLDDKKSTTQLLLRSGCTIQELNAVRKHLSAVKGGRLAKAAYPASIVSLILSDVVGDALDVIGSGPTAPDSSTFADAVRVIEKYGLRPRIPPAVAAYLERGMAGKEQETAKSADACFARTRNFIIGNNGLALAAARTRAAALGYATVLVSSEVTGPARESGRMMARTALDSRRDLKPGEMRCVLFGGETTVAVQGSGTGGRNQELALAFALGIEGTPGISMLSGATDGIDGPTDAAGALVDGATVPQARRAGLAPEAYLDNNDSYTFFQKLDQACGCRHHLLTGPTGTNVMDLQVVLMEG